MAAFFKQNKNLHMISYKNNFNKIAKITLIIETGSLVKSKCTTAATFFICCLCPSV